ncbi:MAG: alpha-L-rhamnosidase N-terminal domain-containing protein [Hyphomonadaceae bacterium]|nr:alpha-L-rhamnosidase N-terminal domain-containing protein [Hyphomonadaceae bacterium]
MERAPFIWSADQVIDPDGFFAAIRGAQPRSDGLNRWFLFRRRVDIPFDVERNELKITSDGKYQLFVNGARVGRGPVRCSPLRQRFDVYRDLGLRRGANVIGVLVHTYGVDTAFYEGVHGHWRASFGDGALWLDGVVSGPAGEARIRSDEAWRALRCDAWRSDTPQVNSGLGFIEVFDANKFPHDWAKIDFDDAAWGRTHVLIAGGGGPEARHGGARTRPFPILAPSELPPMQERARAPLRLVWARRIEPSDLPIERQAYEEALGPISQDVCNASPQGGYELRAGAAVQFDFGDILAGRPRLEFEAAGGEVIDIVVCERLPGEYEAAALAPDARIERRPLLGLDAHVTRIVARPGRQAFETFEWDAVRWMQIHVRNAPQGLRLSEVGLVATRYPGEARGAFECSDPLVNKLWHLGRKTLEVCMHDGWIDCPSREQRQWLGDATVEHLVGEAVFGPQIHALNRHFLRSAAESQRTDGLLEMFAPGDHRRFGWLIPDFSLQWIFNVWDHFEYSGDREFARSLLPTLLRALAWFETQQEEDGRIADLPYWHFQDWAAVGRTGYATVLNAELCGAFEIAARIAAALGWSDEAARRHAQAARLRESLDAHWDDARGLYVDCVDPSTGTRRPRVSQHANAAMILWGGVSEERAARIARAIGDRSRLRLTPAPPIIMEGEPYDEAEHIVLANTFFSHFVYSALAKAGRFDMALNLMRERYGRMIERGAVTLWEGFEPDASLAHGFSATPTWQLIRHVLGIGPAAPGAPVRISPNLCGLEYARGVQPTAGGDIALSMRRRGDEIEVEATLPSGMAGELFAPPGYDLTGTRRLDAGKSTRMLRRAGRQEPHGAGNAAE